MNDYARLMIEVLLGALLVGTVFLLRKKKRVVTTISSVGGTVDDGVAYTPPARGTYGTLRGNLRFFAMVLVIPLLPWLVWFGGGLLPFTLPQPLHLGLLSFIRTLSVGLAAIELVFLVVYPWFAQKYVWKLKQTPEGVIETVPTRWLQPWSYEVPEGRLVARVGGGGGALDYTMRQGDAEIALDQGGVFHHWNDRFTINTTPGSPSTVPVYSIWHWYHVKLSGGLVFGGFYWYTKLHTYELDIVKAEIGGDGKIKLQILPKSRTDHIRVRPFAWAVIADVFTKDRFRVSIVLTFEMCCVNPDKTLFGRDRWERLFSQFVSDKAVTAAKKVSVFDLLGGDAANIRNVIACSIEEDRTLIMERLGIDMQKVQVPGYLEIGTVEERRALTAEAVAIQQAKATVIAGDAEAKAEAAVVRERGRAAAESPHGVEVSLHQALETVNAKGGSVIATLGTGGDDMSRAILAQLQHLTKVMEEKS